MAMAAGAITTGRTVTFVLPSLPPSVNTIYTPVTSVHSATPRFEVKVEWKRWGYDMGRYIKPIPLRPHSLVRIDMWFFYNWYCRNGSLRRADVTNMQKYLIDVIAAKIGFDDKIVKFASVGSSHDAENPRSAVKLTEILTAGGLEHVAIQ